jgi:poly-gamma-glutamate synthase PgsB/CapB
MIIEQVRVMSLARKRDIDVLVMECMAIRPEIQWIAEHRLVRSTIGVITNVRLDHPDHMGLDLDDVANTLSLSIPDSGMLVTTQHRFVPKFKTIAEKQGTSIFIVNNHDISDKEFSQFDRPVFRENLAVALKVCSLLGVSRKTALRGMRNARADPGAMKVFRLRHGKSTIFFVNAFAANDSESTMMVWELWKNRRSYEYIKNLPVVGIFNNRMDRGFRLKDLSQAFINKIQLEHIMLTGQSVFLARRFLIRAGVEPSRISVYGGFFGSKVLVAKLIDDINKMDRNDVVLLGFGNMKGPGQQIVDYFEKTGVELL